LPWSDPVSPEEGVSNVALARRLGVSEAAVRRLVDPDHASRLDDVVLASSVPVNDYRQSVSARFCEYSAARNKAAEWLFNKAIL
jgi:hypothetical protein